MESFNELAQSVLEKSLKLKERLSAEYGVSDKKVEDNDNTLLQDEMKSTVKSDTFKLEAAEYSVKVISEFTNIPEWTLRRLIKSGKLKAQVANDSKNPGKARFVVSKENLKEFLNNNIDAIEDKSAKESGSKLKVILDNLDEEISDVIEYGKLEIKRDEIDMKVESSDSLKIQRGIIEKQMMIKRLEIEKKFYQNYSFENRSVCKDESNTLLGKIKNFLNQELQSLDGESKNKKPRKFTRFL